MSKYKHNNCSICLSKHHHIYISSLFLIFLRSFNGLHNVGDFRVYYPRGGHLCHSLTWLTSLVCFSPLMLLNFLSRSIHHVAAKSVKHMIQQTLGKPVTQIADEAVFGYCVHVWKRQRVSVIQRAILNMSLAALVKQL